MGGALQVRQGLEIKVLNIDSARFQKTKKMSSAKKPKKKTKTPTAYSLIRTTQVDVVGDAPPDQVAQMIMDNGLKIGIRFRKHHQVVSVKYAFGDTLPLDGDFKEVAEDKSVRNACNAVFGDREQWYGFKIPKADIPPITQPRVYFIVTVDNFIPNHKIDFDEVPVVAVLATFPGFKEHYALGVGFFTLGKKMSSIEFDTRAIGPM
jgi:hypothetical protein